MSEGIPMREVLSDEEIERRVRNVAEGFAADGLPVTEERLETGRRIMRGEISGDEAVADILAKYKS